MLHKEKIENLKVKFLGHSSFLIKGDCSLVTDPFDKIGFPFECEKVDYCLSSHDHYDHNATFKVDAKKYVTSENNETADEISLERIDSFHDELRGIKRGQNTIFKFNISKVTFCHLGDLGEKVTENLASRIGKTDVLFVPIGGVYTIDYLSAIRLIELVQPKIAIPMHYKTSKSSINVDTVINFYESAKSLFDVKQTPQTFCISSLPEKTQIILPECRF